MAFCTNCGQEIGSADPFCLHCGTAQQPSAPVAPNTKPVFDPTPPAASTPTSNSNPETPPPPLPTPPVTQPSTAAPKRRGHGCLIFVLLIVAGLIALGGYAYYDFDHNSKTNENMADYWMHKLNHEDTRVTPGVSSNANTTSPTANGPTLTAKTNGDQVSSDGKTYFLIDSAAKLYYNPTDKQFYTKTAAA